LRRHLWTFALLLAATAATAVGVTWRLHSGRRDASVLRLGHRLRLRCRCFVALALFFAAFAADILQTRRRLRRS
jgi:hypothetical protein